MKLEVVVVLLALVVLMIFLLGKNVATQSSKAMSVDDLFKSFIILNKLKHKKNNFDRRFEVLNEIFSRFQLSIGLFATLDGGGADEIRHSDEPENIEILRNYDAFILACKQRSPQSTFDDFSDYSVVKSYFTNTLNDYIQSGKVWER